MDQADIKKLFKSRDNKDIQLGVLDNPNENGIREVLELYKIKN